MGVVKTVRGDDGRPYVSLEDLIAEIVDVKKSSIENNYIVDDRPNFIDLVLKTLTQMEIEYYDKYLFRRKDS